MMIATAKNDAANTRPIGAKERRAHRRHTMVAPAVVMQADACETTPALMVDVSRGGCFLETDRPLALGTVMQIEVMKDTETFQARAKVVFTAPNKGMGLEFIAVGPQEFKTLGTWLDKSLQDSWHTANRQRGQRVQLRIPVRVSGYSDQGARIAEDSVTSEINSLGGSFVLSAQIKEGQRLVLSHAHTKVAVECLVVSSKQVEGNRTLVGVAFVSPNPKFWLVSFPPAPQTKQSNSRSDSYRALQYASRIGSQNMAAPEICLQA
jgi:PilZ domain